MKVLLKIILIVVLLLPFNTLNAQSIKCINPELYNRFHDVKINNNKTESLWLNKLKLKQDSVQIIVFPNDYAKFSDYQKYNEFSNNVIKQGFKLVLINNSKNDYEISNVDGRIYFSRQVFYKNKWITIKSFSKNYRMCGNSFFHIRFLKSNTTLSYIAPCLDGNIKVKYRFIVTIKHRNNRSQIYSNEFEGFLDLRLITDI
jgi:hypothetical protein